MEDEGRHEYGDEYSPNGLTTPVGKAGDKDEESEDQIGDAERDYPRSNHS